MADGESSEELVIVGVDGSAQSIIALRWAIRYGDAMKAKVRAVRAWHFPAAAGPAPIGKAPRPVSDEVRVEMLDGLEHSIAQAYPDGRPEGLEARVTYGHAAPALIDEAQGADLLVVGSKGHGAFTGMLVGSVSLHCVTSASCPVVVVHGKGRPA